MLEDATGFTGIIREDGLGELRGSGVLERIRGESADEVRAILIQRMFALSAARGGAELALRVIDLDAIYPLAVNSEGEIRETGAPYPREEGDDELTPDAAIDTFQRMGGTLARDPEQERPQPAGDGHDGYEADLHPAIRLPRPDMMSRQPDPLHLIDPSARPHEPAAAPAPGPADAELDESLDDFHDEGLDEEFAGLDDAPSAEQAPEPAADKPEAEPAKDWAPVFPRSRGPREETASRALDEEPAGDDSLAAAESAPAPSVPVRSAPAPGSARTPARAAATGESPTLDDFLSDRQTERSLPADMGWRASLRRGTGGLVKLGPGARERREREETAAIRRTFDGSKTIVVVNPKGGAHKTTATLMIAATFGMLRGGYTLAWDNNETRGTLGWRSKPGANRNTAVDLLRQLPHFEISGGATIGDIDRFVRSQGEARFDVLASDDDAASAAIIDDEAFSRLHRTLSRFYRVLVVDTGNNMRASNWEAALDVADQLVIVSTHREDTAASAAWLADGLRERGHEDLLRNAVTILSSPSEKEDRQLTRRLVDHFEQLTRAVVEVPYDHEFVGGGQLDVMRLAPATRDAWRRAVAVIAEGL